MRGLVIRFLVSAAALAITCHLVHGIESKGVLPILAAAFTLGILNAIIRPILFLLTLPINFLTLGLFTFVINGIMLKVTAWIIPDRPDAYFIIEGFVPALVGAVVLAIVSGLLNWLVKDARERRRED